MGPASCKKWLKIVSLWTEDYSAGELSGTLSACLISNTCQHQAPELIFSQYVCEVTRVLRVRDTTNEYLHGSILFLCFSDMSCLRIKVV